MATISPGIFPTDGLRKLSAKETLQRAKALNCTIPSDTKPACTGQVFVGLFFDGTGNNMRADYDELPPAKRKHSNIVKLFQSYDDDVLRGRFKYYIPGVGTPFPEIGDSGRGLGGSGAWNGENRITWAFTRLLNAPHQFVNNSFLLPLAEAANISNNLASIGTPGALRRTALRAWQDKLKLALKDKKPLVEQINLSVFGFSRGAAEARAFCNWLFEVCEQKNGGWCFAGIPIRIQFLGILDTVASVGIANLFGGGIVEGHQSWADNNMEIHPAIEQCVHYVAGHEVRACFPLDSVRVKNSYPGNAKEVMYPGAHSDLGGGYAPNALGISPEPDSSLSIIPGISMYQEARKAGVPLLPWGRLGAVRQSNFTASEQTIADFNDYIKDAKIGSGSVEDMHEKHMSHYFSYRFKYRTTLESRESAFYRRADKTDQGYINVTQRTILTRLGHLGVDPRAPDYSPKQAVEIAKKTAKAAGLESQDAGDRKQQQLYKIASLMDPNRLTPAIEKLFDNYVHDSMAGFNFQLNEFSKNGMGIMKFRKIFKGND